MTGMYHLSCLALAGIVEESNKGSADLTDMCVHSTSSTEFEQRSRKKSKVVDEEEIRTPLNIELG